MKIELMVYKAQINCILLIKRYINNFSSLEIDIMFVKKKIDILLLHHEEKEKSELLQIFINEVDDYFEYTYKNDKHKKQIMDIIDNYAEELKIIDNLGKQ